MVFFLAFLTTYSLLIFFNDFQNIFSFGFLNGIVITGLSLTGYWNVLYVTLKTAIEKG